jgi:Xaa-Pro aminopeptidase
MKSDLNSLMETRGIDALLITGPAQQNPAMVYLTGIHHLSEADLIFKRGEQPTLFYRSMERDEAALSGLATRSRDDYSWPDFLKQMDGDPLKARAAMYAAMLRDTGVDRGRVAVYGKADAGWAFSILSTLQDLMPSIEIVSDAWDSLLLKAMATKDQNEIERIRCMGEVTVEVVGRVAEFLSSQAVKDGVLVRPGGDPLTIDDVKGRINLWLAELGAENPEGTIFAIGRDAAVPHSAGTPSDLLRLGQTIIFDIYPCEAGGGYFYDFTRTWCLGYAPDPVQALYEDVRAVYQRIFDDLRLGEPTSSYQRRTCELFEERGHPTVLSDRLTQRGYVHGLGHGVGLHIHERPFFGLDTVVQEQLEPGMVVTVEPGLYYPERSMGVRLENTVWMRPDGKPQVLAEYPLDLVLPVRGQ